MTALKVPREDVLCFIADYIEEHGWAPTYAEIGKGLGIPSKSTVHRHLLALERNGKLRLGQGSRMIALAKKTHTEEKE